MGYLSRMSGMASPRETMADLLWSGTDRHKAMQSLRQALRQLKTAEETAGVDVVRSAAGHIQIDTSVFASDLMHMNTLLDHGTAADFREAEALWRGEFMTGYDDIDSEFAEWLTVERERVRSELISAAFKHLNRISTEDGGVQTEAGARFVLKLDPAFEAAHRVLIRLYMKLGQIERAEQQYRTCEREMRLHLDAEPDEETRKLLTDPDVGAPAPRSSPNEGNNSTNRGFLPNYETRCLCLRSQLSLRLC
ncbi:putative regulator protein [Stappia aggregata IAM 12614]|uniref:Putative regulator protein n=2 Tax=Roseibium aggregatum TaxID=187304 RepID=A0NQC7_ROSAI|nr:putative regulator protein [Stappia aggregata IAM 12614] [Roseibium aggregatum IAM 12614]